MAFYKFKSVHSHVAVYRGLALLALPEEKARYDLLSGIRVIPQASTSDDEDTLCTVSA